MANSNVPMFIQTIENWACQLNLLNQGFAVTVTSAAPGVCTAGVNVANGLPVYIEGTTAPTGLTKGTIYYAVVSNGSTTFEFGLYPGATGITTSSTGTAPTLFYPISLLSGGAQGSKIERLTIYSTDTAAHNLVFVLVDANGIGHIIGEVTVAAAAANVDVPVNVLAAANFPGALYDSSGNPYLYVASGWSLAVMVINGATAMTAGAEIDVVASGGNF